MKFKSGKFPITDFINRNKIISVILHACFHSFFFVIRRINKLFSLNKGNILIIALHKLGDTVFTIPAIKEIQKCFGKKTIIVCFSESIPVYRIAFKDSNFCAIEHEEFYFGQRLAKREAKKKIKQLKPKLIFDLTGTMPSASLIFNTKARETIGISGKHFKNIYDKFVAVRENPKLVDIYFDAISTVIPIQDRNELKKIPESYNRNGMILIHPFAGWKEKEWNFKNFISLAIKINRNYHVNIIGQTNYIDFDVVQDVTKLNIKIVLTNTSEELIEKIKECSLFIGNDSGPINIANFLGKPTFTIYGSTNSDYTATSRDYQLHYQKMLKCSARNNEKFCLIGSAVYNCPGMQCMNFLSVDDIYQKVIPLVKRYCSIKS